MELRDIVGILEEVDIADYQDNLVTAVSME